MHWLIAVFVLADVISCGQRRRWNQPPEEAPAWTKSYTGPVAEPGAPSGSKR